jgi:hypothetical protein
MTLKPLLSLFSFLFLVFIGQTQIIINEINYRSISPEANIEFIELYNHSENEVNLRNWHLTSGVNFSFPSNAIISPDSYLIVAGNTENCSSFFGLSDVLGPWSGKLSNTGDNIELRNPDFKIIDKVNYDGWNEWPSINHKDKLVRKNTPKRTLMIPTKVELSIQKINPQASGKLAGSWKSEDPTPGKPNAEVFIQNINKTPIIKRVSRSPNTPVSGEAVDVFVQLTNIQLVSSEVNVFLDYQIVDAGKYTAKTSPTYKSAENWTRVNMKPTNTKASVTIFSAKIPKEAQKHRKLIRYRIIVKIKNNFKAFYPDKKHRESNYSYFVNDGQKTFEGIHFNDLPKLQSIELITSEDQTNKYILKGNFDDYRGEGTLIYDGKVHDHIRFRARGKNSRHNKIKRNIKFSLNNNNPLVIKDDYGNKYNYSRSKVSLSGGWINDCNSHGLTEAIIYKTASLMGGFNKHTDYCQLRLIDNHEEEGINGDFWGVYQLMEDWGGTMLAEHGLPDGNIYTYKDWTLSHQGESGPFGEENEDYTTWNEGLGDSKNGKSTDKKQDVSLDFILQNLDLDYYYGDLLLNEITCNGETNYLGQHSYREYFNPKSKKWIAQCGDYDETFGSNHSKASIYPRSESRDWRNMRGLLKREVLQYDTLKIEFSNFLRGSIDLLLNEEQLTHLLNNESSAIFNESNLTNWTELDYARWSQAEGSEMKYSDYKKNVLNWYHDWFINRADHLLNDSISYNNYKLGEEKRSPTENIYFYEEVLIPESPIISYSGKENYALNQLSFHSSGNTNDLNSIEWRVGEWSNPGNKTYSANESPIYEIEPLWNSGELPISGTDCSIPADASLKAGKSYKVRARYKDDNNRWSHWSDPIHIIPSPSNKTETPNLVLSEIMFNPKNKCGVEFIKITNRSFFSADLTHVQFTEGIRYKFPKDCSLSGNKSLILTKDSVMFTQKYGFSPFGEYKNSLANKGENIKLTGAYNQLINEVHYLKDDTWKISKKGCSLTLKSTSESNQNGSNWKQSDHECGTPAFGPESNYTFGIILILLLLFIIWVFMKRRKKSTLVS